MNKRTLSNLFLSAVALAVSLLPLSARAAAGDLYVANNSLSFDNQGIFKFTPAGARTPFGPKSDGHYSIAFDRAGNLYTLSRIPAIGSFLSKYAPDGTWISLSALNDSGSLAIDAAGNILVSQVESQLILKFTPAGTQSTFATDVGRANGLAFDRFGNLFVSNFGDGSGPNGSILKIKPDGMKSNFVSGLNGPVHLAFDNAGNLFVAEWMSGKILKFSPAGTRSTFASGLGELGGLAFDSAGNLFVSDVGNLKIFKFTPTGTKTTFASGVGTFDFEPGALAFEPVTEKLRNISARGVVGTGENVLIGGFILGGNALANNAVVVRAIGPSLSNSGVANPLQNPKVELHNASGAIIASNDNWQATQASQIAASGLAPTDPRESAIFATLPAGAFTAIVRGVSNTTGVALLEIYSLSK